MPFGLSHTRGLIIDICRTVSACYHGHTASLVVFTPTAPFPASPSHPAAPAILSTLKATQKGYADMRGIWSRKCLEAQGKRFIDRAETVDSIVAGKDFGRWLELLLSVADEEYGCIKDLSPLNIPNVVASPYNALLNPTLFLFSTTLTSLIALIKRSPQTSMRTSGRRALLPEFLADFEMALLVKNVPGTETSVGVVERCQVHGPPAGGARRGGGGLVNSKLDDGDEQLILEYYIYDVTMAISSLTANSRTDRCTCETTSSSPRPVRRDIPLRLNSTPPASPRPPQLPSAPRLRPPAAVRRCARLLIEVRELILHRPPPPPASSTTVCNSSAKLASKYAAD
ncbi:hypothetical protein B0H14DRAFT_3480770 [Mycena olivaceomarginata]|nr:hypothetical protein B0H14DRAFT_3480770 [Mycena olivaceomarginata]